MTRRLSTLRLLLTVLICVTIPIPSGVAAATADEEHRDELYGIEDALALELTSPDLYTRFSGASGEGGGLRLEQAGSALVIDGDALTVASSEPNTTTWWLVELAPRDGLFAIQAVLVTQGDSGRSENGGDVGSLRVLVGNDSRQQPSPTGGAWTECAPRGDRSLRAQLFLCCSSAPGSNGAVVGRAAAVYESSVDGRVRPLNLNEVTVLGTPRQCPPGLFGTLCERRCARCVGGAAAASKSAVCDCGLHGCYETSTESGRRPISECWLASSSTPLAATAEAAGRLELISNRQRPPFGECAGRRRRTSVNGVEEYIAVRHAAFDMSAVLESMVASKASSVEVTLLIGNDSRAPPYAGSRQWATCGTSPKLVVSNLTPLSASAGEGLAGRRTSVVLSCDAPTVGRYAVAMLGHAARPLAEDYGAAGQQSEDVDSLGYIVLPAEQLLGYGVYIPVAKDAANEEGSSSVAAGAVDLSFLGYYWMNERRYATYMMLAFPALFAIIMMAATFAIACIKRKKVVADNAYYSATAAYDDDNDLPPLLGRTADSGAATQPDSSEAAVA